MAPSLKLVHSTDEVQPPNPVSAGGWHRKIENEAEEFSKLSYRYGFKAYAIVKLTSNLRGIIKPEIQGTNLSPEFLQHIDPDGGLDDCSLFRVLAQSCVPFAWQSGVNAYTGLIGSEDQHSTDQALDELLMSFDYEGGFCVPVHDPLGTRSVVVYIGPHFDNSAKHAKLVVDTIELFDASIRSVDHEDEAEIQLTELELSCLDCSISGADVEATAQKIGMSRHVVAAVLNSLCEKLDAKSVPQAVAKAVMGGIVGL